MNIFKPLVWAALLATLYCSGALQAITTRSQEVVLQSGLFDARVNDNSRDAWDYNFTIKDLKGNKIQFTDFRNKVVFLNLWATWCAPCRSEMASIQKLYDSINKENISFVMLSLDRDSDFGKLKSYINSRAFTFPVYAVSGDLADPLNVPSIPTTFIIAKDGTIALKEVGMKNYNTSKFKKYLESLATK